MSSSNLYHKQPAPRPNRRDRVLVIDSKARKEPGGKKINPDRVSEEYVRKHIKIFALIAVTMLLLLGLSIKVVEFVWGRSDRKIMHQPVQEVVQETPAVLSTNSTGKTSPALTPTPPLSDMGNRPGGDVETIIRWGKVLEDAGEYEGALDRYTEALKIAPDNLNILSQAGRLNIRLSRYADAVAVLTKAREYAEGNPDVLNDLGVALTFNGQAQEAADLYAGLLTEYPDYVPALFNRGYALIQLKDNTAARPLLEEYIRRKSDDAMALGVLAVLELSEKNHDRALELLDQAILTSPSWKMPYLDAATICATLNRPEKAIDYLERALAVATPTEVYQRYQSAVFNEIRPTEAGRNFEKIVAEQARKAIP